MPAGPRLSARDRGLLDGAEGEARRLAMRVLVRLAEMQEAPRLIDVTRAHIDGCILTGPAIVAFAERLVKLGGRLAVPTSTNVISVDRRHWRDQGVPEAWAGQAGRLADAYLALGAAPTFTCSPYQEPDPPRPGEHIAWAESNAIAFANGALGARTNRYGDLVDACAALVGRVPLVGLHLDAPRLGRVVFELDDRGDLDDAFFPVLGYLVGAQTGGEVPVVDGLTGPIRADDLKAFAAAAATAGAVGMFHVVGVTPEAPTRAAALGGRAPARIVHVGAEQLGSAWSALSTPSSGALGSVAFGSPHLSLPECRELASLVEGERGAPGVGVVLTTSVRVHEAAVRLGLAETLERFGAQFVCDTCVLNTPLLPPGGGTFMTNSAKYAHYAPGVLGRDVVFGSTRDCVRSAIAGRPVVATPGWLAA